MTTSPMPDFPPPVDTLARAHRQAITDPPAFLWTGHAPNGTPVQYWTTDPDLVLYINPVNTPTMIGVQLVGGDGRVRRDWFQYTGPAKETPFKDPLADWLLQQVTEDARLVHETGGALVGWATYRFPRSGNIDYTSPVAQAQFDGAAWTTAGKVTYPHTVVVVFDPVTLKAECDTKRRIIQECVDALMDDTFNPVARATLQAYADLYIQVGRTGFREEWRA